MDNLGGTSEKEDAQARRAQSRLNRQSFLAQQNTYVQQRRMQQNPTMPMPTSAAYTDQLPSNLTVEVVPVSIPFQEPSSNRASMAMEELRSKSCQRCLVHSVQTGNFPTCKDQNPSRATCAVWSFRDAASGHPQPLMHTAHPFDTNPFNNTFLSQPPGPVSEPVSEPSTQLSAFEQEKQRLIHLNKDMSGEDWAKPWTELRESSRSSKGGQWSGGNGRKGV
jgi:hypothetical protein